MNRHIKKNILKIFTLSTFIVLLFNIGDNLLNANVRVLNTKQIKNNLNFKKVNNNGLGKIGVAITTNIGIRYKETKRLPSDIYKEIFSVEDILNNKESSDEPIGRNMVLIREYLNMLKTDPKKIINSSYDKSSTLEAYIEQLEFRYQDGVSMQKNIIKQRDVFINSINAASNEISNLKIKIANDFKNGDSKGSLENIDKYLELNQKLNFAKIYISYINHFIDQYNFLNNYSKNLAEVLISNRDAIIKDSYVVVPKKGGLDAIKKFDLIYME